MGRLIAITAMLVLCGCTAIGTLLAPATPAQANTVAAAESLYIAADKALLAAVQQQAVSKAEASRLGVMDSQVYAALVNLRTAVEAGNSAAIPALLAAFNTLDTPFFAALQSDGIATSTGASP